MFKQIKNDAKNFLDGYQKSKPATYAAALQAVGGLLILDGFIGIDNPVGDKKRPGILGALISLVVGVAIIVAGAPWFTQFFGVDRLTETTSAKVVNRWAEPSSTVNNDPNNPSVNNSGSSTCNVIAQYTVNGTEYTQQSVYSSSEMCGLAEGQTIQINYNPNQPSEWGYNVGLMKNLLKFIPFMGWAVAITGGFTFLVRLISIIFGWKLLSKGRALARTLPKGANLGNEISTIRDKFKKFVFKA